jgi:phosphoglycolate phosphatase-like HAD superfamily hydrolase
VSITNIKAIIWDYDGTLVDTRYKNLNVTRNIIESIIETDAEEFSTGYCFSKLQERYYAKPGEKTVAATF